MNRKREHRLAAGLAVAAAVGLAGSAAAQVTPIGPFVGEYFEGFEGGSPSILPRQCFATAGVFSGTATLCTYSATSGNPTSGLHHLQITWSQSCDIGAFHGSRYVGNATGRFGFIFTQPVGMFGGYFGSNSTATVTGGATVQFYDQADQLFNTQFIFFPACGNSSWHWEGWELSQPAYRIMIYGAASSGASLTLDAMEYSVFVGGPPECPADWNADGQVNSQDISAFITDWLNSVSLGLLDGDFNGDGLVNSQDISAFITAWLDAVTVGC